MNRKAKLPFDPKVFLSKVNGGRGKRRGTVSSRRLLEVASLPPCRKNVASHLGLSPAKRGTRTRAARD
jgi:hypothetical protein